jgi:hypothetical protein
LPTAPAEPGRRRRSGTKPDEDEGRFVTQREAAELCGCSKDTIIRARLAGRFPRATLDANTWAVPVSDLAAAGLYDPAANTQADPTRAAGADVADPGQAAELARAEARIAALEDLIARQDEELRFLRQLTVDTLGRRAS